MFNILLVDQNNFFTLGLSRNLFCILHNIPTVVSITHRGDGFKWRIYVRLIVIDIRIGNKLWYGGGGWYESMRLGEDVIKVIECLIVQVLALFLIHGSVGFLIYTYFHFPVWCNTFLMILNMWNSEMVNLNLQHLVRIIRAELLKIYHIFAHLIFHTYHHCLSRHTWGNVGFIINGIIKECEMVCHCTKPYIFPYLEYNNVQIRLRVENPPPHHGKSSDTPENGNNNNIYNYQPLQYNQPIFLCWHFLIFFRSVQK